MKACLDILRHILDNGSLREDRTGVGTAIAFALELRTAIAQRDGECQ